LILSGIDRMILILSGIDRMILIFNQSHCMILIKMLLLINGFLKKSKNMSASVSEMALFSCF